MPNILQYPIALFGVLRAGMVVVNTNPLYTARELEHQLRDSGAKCIVIVENFAHVLQQVLPRTDLKKVLVTGIGDLLGLPRGVVVNFVLRHVRKQVPAWNMPGAMAFKSALSSGLGLKLEPPALGPNDIAFLQYTGGTTGIAKAAVLTHRNMIANVLQTTSWIFPAMRAGGARVIITALPLYHIFALTTNCLAFLPFGACNVLITNPRDFSGFVAELKRHKFNFISGVNTLFNALLHTPGFETVDFSALRVSFAGGMAVQAVVAERWKKITGCAMTQGWGLTETSPVATATAEPLDDPPGIRVGSSGLTGEPNHGFVPNGNIASSWRLAFPTIRASADRKPLKHAASRVAGLAFRSTARQPAVVGTPWTSIRSFTATRGPVPLPSRREMKVVTAREYATTVGQQLAQRTRRPRSLQRPSSPGATALGAAVWNPGAQSMVSQSLTVCATSASFPRST
jgi:acyl-CoA synthetase (AMP-forming)/AMP-acid ligase II